jgi:excisionase family DNA binding protein
MTMKLQDSQVVEEKHNAGSSLLRVIEGNRCAITASEVAEFLSLSRITIYKMAKAGRIPSFRIGAAVRFDPCAIAQWLRENSL